MSTTAIKATEATLKSFLGVEASSATAISASIQRARRQADLAELVLEDAIEEIGGEGIDSNDHYAWIVRGGLTLYLDKKSGEFYVGAM